jgi:hypothetical protein
MELLEDRRLLAVDPTWFEAVAPDLITRPDPNLPGDWNTDGIVDAADYVMWRDNLNQPVSLPNDPTPGTVTQSDNDVWRTNFGKKSGLAEVVFEGVSITVVENEWLIKLTPEATAQVTKPGDVGLLFPAFISAGVLILAGTGEPGELLVRMPSNDPTTVANLFTSLGVVSHFEPNGLALPDAIPNDNEFSLLWGLHNTGQAGGVPVIDPVFQDERPLSWNCGCGHRCTRSVGIFIRS